MDLSRGGNPQKLEPCWSPGEVGALLDYIKVEDLQYSSP